MKKIIFTIITALSLVACSNIQPNESKERKNNDPLLEKQQESQINVGVFSSIPKEIDGCACYFYMTEQDKKQEKYVCVNDFASIAFVYVNGRLQKFILKEHKKTDNSYFYSNEEFNLEIHITKKNDAGDEGSDVSGTITVSNKSQNITKDFVGNCGC